jgi:hypothetical protein
MSGLLVDAFTLSMGDSLVLGMSPSRSENPETAKP